MRKKRSGGGGANWMDTYGDMVTLLLCFFVMLYSMSTLDEEKWLALVESFNPNATVQQVAGDGEMSNLEQLEQLTAQQQQQVADDIEKLYQAMQAYVQQENLTAQVSVTKGDGYVFVSFDNTVFFEGNRYTLREEGKKVLDEVAQCIADVSSSVEEVRVLGHTAQEVPGSPNDPTADRFLASNRAAVVTVYLQEKNIVDPARLVSVGYGEWRPVAENDTSEGRAQNRRVELLITGLNVEHGIGDDIAQYYTMRSGESETASGTEGDAGSSGSLAQTQSSSGGEG